MLWDDLFPLNTLVNSPVITSNNLESWEDRHVRLLIECYMKYKDHHGFEKIPRGRMEKRSLRSENVVPLFSGWSGGL